MAPLIFLLATFVLVYLLDRIALGRRLGLSFIGRASMAVMLIVTGISHFTNTDEMVAMMPDFLPAKRELAYLTGCASSRQSSGFCGTRRRDSLRSY